MSADPRSADVRTLLDRGKSRAEIAIALGLTKNQVIGICYRAGWSTPRGSSAGPSFVGAEAVPAPARPSVMYCDAVAHLASPGCQWPGVGDGPMLDPFKPGFRFCAASVSQPGNPYCRQHEARAWTPTGYAIRTGRAA